MVMMDVSYLLSRAILSVKNSWLARIFALAVPLALFYSVYVLDPMRSTVLPLNTHPVAKPTGDRNPAIIDSDTSIYRIPEKVWHSAETIEVSEKQCEGINSWRKTNPSFHEELLTDSRAEKFVHTHFQDRPDIIQVYDGISIPILRADLLRYLIILAQGGYWSDLDVTAEKPSTDWVPAEYKKPGINIDMIVGLELDIPYRGPETELASQFCNWVFAAQPSSRNLKVIVDTVMTKLNHIASDHNVTISGITPEMLPDVSRVTGPKIMTTAILKSVGQLLGRTVDDRDFSGIKQAKLVGDVLIMPGVSFAAAQNGCPKDQGDALATHQYVGSCKQADAEAKGRKRAKEQSYQVPAN